MDVRYQPSSLPSSGMSGRLHAGSNGRDHAEVFHLQHLQPLDLQQVQLDELWLRIQKQVLWLAMAVAVGSRLWLGQCVGPNATSNSLVRS